MKTTGTLGKLWPLVLCHARRRFVSFLTLMTVFVFLDQSLSLVLKGVPHFQDSTNWNGSQTSVVLRRAFLASFGLRCRGDLYRSPESSGWTWHAPGFGAPKIVAGQEVILGNKSQCLNQASCQRYCSTGQPTSTRRHAGNSECGVCEHLCWQILLLYCKSMLFPSDHKTQGCSQFCCL